MVQITKVLLGVINGTSPLSCFHGDSEDSGRLLCNLVLATPAYVATTSFFHFCCGAQLALKKHHSSLSESLMPFSYVELCSEHGAEEPTEEDFW